MVYKTYKAARNSLLEFTPGLRKRHRIIKFWSSQDNAYRYARQLVG